MLVVRIIRGLVSGQGSSYPVPNLVERCYSLNKKDSKATFRIHRAPVMLLTLYNPF